MKNFKSNRKSTGAASAASKACAWILSIMLVVTGMGPSFASNAKADKDGVVKTAAKAKASSKTKEEGNDNAASQEKTAKKPSASKKDVSSSSKKQKTPKDKADKNGKKKRFKNKREQEFALNESGGVYAEIDNNDNIEVLAKNNSGDMHIEKDKWWSMAKQFGAVAGNGGWKNARVKNINFIPNGLYLPERSEYFFMNIKGEINGCEKLNTSKVTDMTRMFAGATKANPDVSQWDTSKATAMGGMFDGATSANPDVSNWNVSKVIHMSLMFQGAKAAKPNVSNWNVSRADHMNHMFEGATSANPNVSNWNVSKVTSMINMFEGATSANPNVSNWKVSNVTDMTSMFEGATKANPDVSKWNVSNVKYMGSMFKGAIAANPNVSKWNVSKVTSMTSMFEGATKANPDVSNWDVSNVTNISYMFHMALSSDPQVSKWNVSKVTDMKFAFSGSKLEEMDLSRWKLNSVLLNNPKNMEKMFLFPPGNPFKRLNFIKTPKGLKTSISGKGYSAPYKIVKLKHGKPASVESENAMLREEYEINTSGDKDVAYDIYSKKDYCGVTFDVNGGDNESFGNHEIVKKGESFRESKGELPEEVPAKVGYIFRGWAYDKTDKVPTFDENKRIDSDTTLYAVYKHIEEIPLNYSGNVYVMPKIETNGRITLDVKVKNLNGDVRIHKGKWTDMAKEFGAEVDDDKLHWEKVGNKIDILFLANVKAPFDMSRMFNEFKGNISGLDKLDVSEVIDATSTFLRTTGNISGDSFSNWKTKNITKFSGMFAFSTIEPDVSSWNMSSALYLDHMFKNNKKANPDVAKWNISDVIDLQEVFCNAEDAEPDVSRWDVSKVTNMKQIFSGCGIKKVDLSNWKLNSELLSEPENMEKMFWQEPSSLAKGLDFIKTPRGLRTSISGKIVPGYYKIVMLEHGQPVSVETEVANLGNEYEINTSGDKGVAYNIYTKHSHCGVTFDVNGGDGESFRNHEIVEKGKSIKESKGVLPEEKPSKKDHRFKGWDKDSGATGSGNFTEDTKVDSDITVYAIYEPKAPAKLKFNAMGGELGAIPAEINTFIGDSLGDKFPVEHPAKNGYEFVGWSKRAEDSNTGKITPGAEFNKDTVIDAATVEVYAVWKSKHKLTVSFDGNGGELGSIAKSKEVYEGTALGADFPVHEPTNVANMDPKRAGHTFIGWGYDKASTMPEVTKDTVFTKSETLYAIWKKGSSDTITVRFNANGGSYKSGKMPSETFERGTALGARFPTEIPKKQGKVFLGYANRATATEPDNITPETIFNEGADVYAVWKDAGNVYKVEFDMQGGKPEIAPIYAEAGKKLGDRFPKITPRKEGYEFVGYTRSKAEADAGEITDINKVDKDTNITKDTLAHAVFKEKKTVTVTFAANGGNGNMDATQVDKNSNYKLPECTFTPPADKVFDKWSVAIGSAQVVDKNPGDEIVASDNVTVTAKWKAKPIPKVNITFDNDGGAGSMDAVSIDKGSSYTLPVCTFVPPAGKEFDRWSVTVGSAPAVDKKPGESVTASDNVTVKAMWKEKTLPVMAKVTLYAEGVAGYPQVIEVKRGETLGDKLPAKIEKAGYDFLGYSKENNGDINFFSDTAVKEDMNVYAVYKSNAPVVKKVEAIRLTAGSLRMQLGDLTDVLAIVSPSDATDKRVKFTLDREDIIKIVSVDDSAARVEAIGEGRVKVKAEALDGSGVTGEITIEVVRKPAKKVQVKLNAEGVAGYPKTLETEEGTSLDANLPMDLKKDGYIFRGWSYEKNGEVNFTKHTQVSKNTEIHAVFKKDEVSALFIAEGAAGFPKAVMVERGKKIGDQLPAAPVRTGYEFEGWSTESSFGTVNLTKDTVIDKDTIVYAVFKKQGAIVKQVSSITLGVTKSNIKAGDEADVIASILPADADDKRLSWESSAPDKLKIEQTGDNFIRIKAEEEGTYTITAKAKDGSNVKASIEIKVLSKISAPISNKVKVMISADGVADYPKLIEIDKNTTLHGKLPTNIDKQGYKFKGFTKTMGNAADFDDNEVIKEDTRLYAVFEQTAAPTKKVTGIELSKSKSKVAVGDTVDILPSITPEDADNKALDYTVDNKDKALIYKNPDGTLRLYAMLKGKVVVTAKATDGSNVTKSIEIEITEAEKEQVTITLNADGINGYPKQLTVDKGEALGNALPNVLDKEDYDFRGWSTTPNGIIDVNRLTPMTSSISIYAVFTKKQVNVRMLAEGVNGYPKNVSLDIHSTLGSELPASLNKEGYTFKGWSKDSFTGEVNVTAATKVDESMTIYAVFERKTPVVQKVESIKIEDLSSESKVINKEFNLFANILPESADDKTLEWSASDPAVKIVQKQNNLVSVTVSAAGNYSITAKAKDGSNVEDTFAFTVGVPAPDVRTVKLLAKDIAGYPKEMKVTKGENLAGRLPMDLEKDGYTFLGWSKTQGAAEADFDASLPVTDDLTLYAVFKKNVAPPAPGKTRVTLDGNGGVLAGGAQANIDIESGDTIKTQLESAVANKIFTKPGYKFIGFSRSKFATAADYNLESPVYTDMTLYAVYEEAPVFTDVTIKYDIFDMENVVIENVAEGKPIGSKLDGHVKQRDGYRFLGFAKTQDAVKPDFFRKSTVTNGLVLYPVYKEVGKIDKVNVAFKLNDGTDASLQSKEVIRYESLGDKMPTKDSVPERDGYLFTGWAKSKAAKYPDFFRGTTVKGHMTVYAVWKSLYDERLGQAVLKVAAKAKGYELTIEPPKANLHTGFDIFRSEKKDFKPSKDNKVATVDRNTLKYQDDKADNGKAYYYAVRAINADGSYNGTKVTFIGKLSDSVLAAPLPKDKGVTATVAGKGAVSLEFNKTMAAAGYKVTVTAPYDKKFKAIERFVEAGKLAAAGGNKVKANLTGLPMGKFLAFKLEALETDNTKLVEYGNSFAFMLGAVEKLSAKVNKKSRVLNIKFKAMKGVSGYEAKIVIGGKVKTIKLKKGKKKLRGFIVGSIKLPKKKGNYTFTIRAFKKIGKLKYFGQTITKVVR